jgi:hypothetical protein
MFSWPNKVYTYFKFGMHSKLSPKMYMEVEQQFIRGHEDVEVTWEDDIATNRVELEVLLLDCYEDKGSWA